MSEAVFFINQAPYIPAERPLSFLPEEKEERSFPKAE
jgi:hypothetical protein